MQEKKVNKEKKGVVNGTKEVHDLYVKKSKDHKKVKKLQPITKSSDSEVS